MKMLLPVLLMLATGKTILPGEVKVKTLPPESREVLDYLPRNIVIAHRGTTYWAPEAPLFKKAKRCKSLNFKEVRGFFFSKNRQN